MNSTQDNTNQPITIPFYAHENDMMRYERQLKRMWIALIVAIVAIVLTVGSFLWYLNQYDYVSNESVTVDGADGVANYIGKDGTIYNGESNSETNTNSSEEERALEGNS